MIKFFIAKIPLFISVFYFYFLLRFKKLISSEYEFYILKNFVKKNDSVLDIGSNIGRYTFELSSLVGKNGIVYSFEPMQRSFLILSSLLYLSNIKNIILINLAASNKTKKIVMQELSSPKRNYLFDTNTESKIVDKVTKEAFFNYSFKIDDFNIKEKISFIKIDCEGHEIEVLSGATKLIKKNKPTLLVENNSKKLSIFLYKFNYVQKKLNIKSRNAIFVNRKIKND
jgi:FkbM family methyltransferase